MLRREFLTATGRLAATAGLLRLPVPIASASTSAAAAAAKDSLFRWERIKPDAWVVFNGGGNTLVLADRAGAIVVDCKINGMGQLLRAEIESRVGPIAAIVITHHHGDHSGGYPAFTGTRAIAHAAALPRIRARAERIASGARTTPKTVSDSLLDSLAKDFDVPRSAAAERAVATDVTRMASVDLTTCVPAEQFADRTELRIGGTTLELTHVGPAHTDNDVFVRDRQRGILHTGDLLFHRHHASIDTTAGGTMQGWLDALGDVRRACDGETVVIAGHGPTGKRVALDEQATYFERLRDLVARERAAGRSRDEIVKLPNTLFPTYGFVAEWPDNLGIAFDEFEKLEKRKTA
jgi:glyoxylase-like metal-dependent hydrolase (beta-lactamase superfamily II)